MSEEEIFEQEILPCLMTRHGHIFDDGLALAVKTTTAISCPRGGGSRHQEDSIGNPAETLRT